MQVRVKLVSRKDENQNVSARIEELSMRRKFRDAGHVLRRRAGLRFVLVLLPLVGSSRRMRAESTFASEDDIRAAMVQHLTMFVDWPPWKMDAAHQQFNVCLLGTDSIGPALENVFRNKMVNSKPVIVQRVETGAKLDGCHLLYLGSGLKRDFQRSLPALEQAAVLTVSERSGADVPGQIVGFPAQYDHVRIEVNLHAAQRSNLTISSKLLRLATLVGQP